MATTKRIENLVRFVVDSDLIRFQKEVERIIADESRKNHTVLANRLKEDLHRMQRKNFTQFDENEENSELLLKVKSRRKSSSLILNKKNKSIFNQIVEEHKRADLLQSYGVEPVNRILLYGASGNGKTSLSEVIAYELSLPLFIVRYESLIDSLLGKTSKGLQEVFDFVKTKKCILFFDELDIIAKDRGESNESGEIKRTLNSLLIQIDHLPSYVILITATNHETLLDSALDRRFQLKMKLNNPNKDEIKSYLEMFQTKNNFYFNQKNIVSKLEKLSFAKIEQFCVDIFKGCILENKLDNPRSIIEKTLSMYIDA